MASIATSGATQAPVRRNTFPSRLQAVTRLAPVMEMTGALPVPLPSSDGNVGIVPLPTNVGEGGHSGPPPDYVSQYGDVVPDNLDSLERAEGDFRSVPRLDGGSRFDPEEYVRRISHLNEVRASRGLPPLNGVTPSTYTR
jgi:hypothetical protein